MKPKTILAFIALCCTCGSAAGAENTQVDLTEPMKKSLVYLNVSAYSYEQLQPWKPADLVNKNGYGCAVARPCFFRGNNS